MVMTDALYRAREKQLEKATTAHAVSQLQQQWSDEDAAASAAEKTLDREVASLRREVAALRAEVRSRPTEKQMIDRLAPAIGAVVGKLVKEVEQRIAEQIKAMPPAMTYCGIWSRSVGYSLNNVVTHGGSMWVAKAESTDAEPGTTPSWQLAVRRGSDAKTKDRGVVAV